MDLEWSLWFESRHIGSAPPSSPRDRARAEAERSEVFGSRRSQENGGRTQPRGASQRESGDPGARSSLGFLPVQRLLSPSRGPCPGPRRRWGHRRRWRPCSPGGRSPRSRDPATGLLSPLLGPLKGPLGSPPPTAAQECLAPARVVTGPAPTSRASQGALGRGGRWELRVKGEGPVGARALPPGLCTLGRSLRSSGSQFPNLQNQGGIPRSAPAS